MEHPSSDYRALITRALTGRSVTATAREFGLPKDSIRYVLQGHDPRLSRAHEICRALGVRFTIGLPERDDQEASGAVAASDPERAVAPRTGRVPIRDLTLAQLLARLADHWETVPAEERQRLGAGFAAVLDLVGVKEMSALRRELEYLVWRLIEAARAQREDGDDAS